MLVHLDENNKIKLTEKAYFVKEFKELDNYFRVNLNNPERAVAAFGVLYYMYHFDSQFLAEYEDEVERFKHVQSFVYLGDEIKKTKIFIRAENRYKSLMTESQAYAYITMKGNFKKLREYANRITLSPIMEDTADPLYDPASKEIQVDYKEFAAINSLLPKQEEELRKFKETLQKHMVNEVDVYGGGNLGLYE